MDSRTLLEAFNGSLAFLLPIIVSLHLPAPYDVVAPAIVGAIIVFNTRLLVKNGTDAVDERSATLNQALARNNVLVSAATPTVIRKADEAAQSIGAKPSTPAVEPAPAEGK